MKLLLVALASALGDVQDIRSGALPIRYEMLGWDGATGYVQTLLCSEGGTTSCKSDLHAVTGSSAKKTALLDVNEVYCGKGSTCDALDAATVDAFRAEEKKARAAMPKSTKGVAAADASTVFGKVAGEATKIEIRQIDATVHEQPVKRIELVLTGKGGARELLGVVDEDAWRVDSTKLRDAFVSPDSKTAIVMVEAHVGVMCWDFSELRTVGADMPRKKASLANTIGFVAYKKSDMVAALSGFTEATTTDPSFGLGWYNRASIESRNGDVAKAKASFGRATAIDASFAKRACKDDDFKSLRAADASLFQCA